MTIAKISLHCILNDLNVLIKCSCNLRVTKVNNNLDVTSVWFTLYYVIKLPHIQFFALHAMISFKQTISITEVFHFKNSRLGFSFSPPVSSEITQCRFF